MEKATNCPFTCRINLHVCWNWHLGKYLYGYTWERNISLIPQRRICFPCKTRYCFLMVCSQVILWSSVTVFFWIFFFWRVSNDKLLLLLHSTNQMWWTKWYLCSSDKTANIWDTQLCNSSCLPFFPPLSCNFKKGECYRNVWLKLGKEMGLEQIKDIKYKSGDRRRCVSLTQTLH